MSEKSFERHEGFTHADTVRSAATLCASGNAQPGKSPLFRSRSRFTSSGRFRLRVEITPTSEALPGPSHRSACATGAAGLPAHRMTLGPACWNRTFRPPIVSVLVEPSVTYEAFAGTALVRPSWLAATRPSGMIRTPSRRSSAAMAASQSTGAGRFRMALILGKS